MNTNDEGVELKEGDEGYVPDSQGDGDDKNPDGSDKVPDEKTVETPEAKRARLKRQLEQLEKKHPELAEKKSPKESKKSDDLDYGQEAYLIANGYKDSDEMDLARDIMNSTGKTLKEVVSGKYFQTEITSLREEKAAKAAIPDSKNRSGQTPSTSVEYWIQKGELPPLNMPKLRQDVVNAKMKAATEENVFTSNPVASNM